jgi:hypothetical protein
MMGRLRAIAAMMLRILGLDDESMDRQEARLTQDFHEMRAKSTGPLSEWALGRMSRALRDARRYAPQVRDSER